MGETTLSGKTILITRPAQQAEGLSRSIRAAGGEPVIFPAIEIAPPADPAHLDEVLGRLEQFDLAIFISPTAVACAWARITATCVWPKNLSVAAVGQGSARALHERGFADVIAPMERFDSEALLALPELHIVTGKRIVIFRGNGGRELLAQSLARRGAQVEYAECYRRLKPTADISPLLQNKFDALILTSREALANFCEMLGPAQPQFKNVPVFVPHERIAEAARKLNFDNVQITSDGDAGTIDAMIKFFS